MMTELMFPFINIIGNREITVDGFRGIEDFSESEVTFCAGNMLICIGGSDLIIRYMSVHTIVVAGKITSIKFS